MVSAPIPRVFSTEHFFVLLFLFFYFHFTGLAICFLFWLFPVFYPRDTLFTIFKNLCSINCQISINHSSPPLFLPFLSLCHSFYPTCSFLQFWLMWCGALPEKSGGLWTFREFLKCIYNLSESSRTFSLCLEEAYTCDRVAHRGVWK